MSYQFVAGDTGSKLEITCTDNETGDAINLTGATVTLKWIDESGTAINQTMTIIDATNGIVEYQFGANELFDPQMIFEVKITDSSGEIIRNLQLLKVGVRPLLGS